MALLFLPLRALAGSVFIEEDAPHVLWAGPPTLERHVPAETLTRAGGEMTELWKQLGDGYSYSGGTFYLGSREELWLPPRRVKLKRAPKLADKEFLAGFGFWSTDEPKEARGEVIFVQHADGLRRTEVFDGRRRARMVERAREAEPDAPLLVVRLHRSIFWYYKM